MNDEGQPVVQRSPRRWRGRILFVSGVLLLAAAILLLRLSQVTDQMYHALVKDPDRVIPRGDNIVSPADGTVLYVKPIRDGIVPDIVKRDVPIPIADLLKGDPETGIEDGYLIGIYMDTESVHINRAPRDVVFVRQHVFNGPHMSMMDMDKAVILTRMVPGWTTLKKALGMDPFSIDSNGDYILKSARTTEVFEAEEGRHLYVVRIADYWVGNILTWVEPGAALGKGQKYGMITWGSQTDICFESVPGMQVEVKVGEYVYAGETILASF